MAEFDINKVTSEFLNSQIDNIFSLGKNFIKGTNDTMIFLQNLVEKVKPLV